MVEILRINVLGPLAIEVHGPAGRRTTAPPGKNAALLLGALALRPGDHNREELIDLIWDLDADILDDKILSGRLDRETSNLRNALEPARDAVVAHRSRGTVELVRGDGLTVDADLYRALETSGSDEDLLAALRLNRGPILQGIDHPWFEPYRREHWRRTRGMIAALTGVGLEEAGRLADEVCAGHVEVLQEVAGPHRDLPWSTRVVPDSTARGGGEALTRERALLDLRVRDSRRVAAAASFLVRSALCGDATGSVQLPTKVTVAGERGTPSVKVTFLGSGSEAESLLGLSSLPDLVLDDERVVAAVLDGALSSLTVTDDDTAGTFARGTRALQLIDDKAAGAALTARVDEAAEHLTAGQSVALVGRSGSGKTVTAAQVSTRLRSFGWTVSWLDFSEVASREVDLIAPLLRTPVGGAGRHLFVLDNAQADPGAVGRAAALLAEARPLLAVPSVVLVVGWESAKSLIETTFASPVEIPCSGEQILQSVMAGLTPELADDDEHFRELRQLSRDDVLIARIALAHRAAEARWPSDAELAAAAFDAATGGRALSADALALLYHLSSLGEFEVEASRAFAESDSADGLSELMDCGAVRQHGSYVAVGHRTLATLVAEHIRVVAPDVVAERGAPIQLTLGYLRAAGDRQLMATLERLDLAAVARVPTDQHGTAFLARAWDSVRTLSGYLRQQTRVDATWGENLASALFAAETFARFDHVAWQEAADWVRSRWAVPPDGSLPAPIGPPTTERIDFDEIQNAMRDQDARRSDFMFQPAPEVDLDRFHRTWVLGLLLGFEAHARDRDEDRLVALKRSAAEQIDPEGWFYPARVPWVTARVLLGLGAAGESIHSNPAVRAACDWLRRPYPDGPYRSGAWESGTGIWNTTVSTTAMCVAALVGAGVSIDDPAVQAGKAYLLSKRSAWSQPDRELDARDVLQFYLVAGGRWRTVSDELQRLVAWARDPDTWSHVMDTASDSKDESSKVPAVTTALIGIIWSIVKAELPLLLEGLATGAHDAG